VGKHIVVVDGEEHTQRALSIVLRRAGFEVSTAEDAPEAVARILESAGSASPVAALVLDDATPEQTAVHLHQTLAPQAISVPMLIVSSRGAGESLSEELGRECVVPVSKPFTPDEFLHSLAMLLGKHSHRNEIHRGSSGG
jgi:DNA-binding NtrC family response regulator